MLAGVIKCHPMGEIQTWCKSFFVDFPMVFPLFLVREVWVGVILMIPDRWLVGRDFRILERLDFGVSSKAPSLSILKSPWLCYVFGSWESWEVGKCRESIHPICISEQKFPGSWPKSRICLMIFVTWNMLDQETLAFEYNMSIRQSLRISISYVFQRSLVMFLYIKALYLPIPSHPIRQTVIRKLCIRIFRIFETPKQSLLKVCPGCSWTKTI